MKLSEIRQILSSQDIQLTKSLGQNFLHDANQLRRIIAMAGLSKSDSVLEIGPGLGALTELLVQAAREVLAIEKDGRLVQLLRERLGAERYPGLKLVHADALEYLAGARRDWTESKLVSNLPYSVASPILVELSQNGRGPRRIVATLQLEVAKRLMAGPNCSDYGILTLLVQLDYEPRDWFKIPASCFFPQPDVDSACVWLERRGDSLVAREARETFVSIVKRAFSQRRKIMQKLLRQDWVAERLDAAYARLKLSREARAENLTPQQFAELAQLLLTDTGYE